MCTHSVYLKKMLPLFFIKHKPFLTRDDLLVVSLIRMTWLCVCRVQESEDVKDKWSSEREDCAPHLQISQIQELEQENTDFLAALEDAMEQYKQQVIARLSPCKILLMLSSPRIRFDFLFVLPERQAAGATGPDC